MADGYHYPKTFGGQPKPTPVGARHVIARRRPCGRWLVSSNRGTYGAVWADVQRRESPRLPRTVPWGTQWGQLDDPRRSFGGFGPGGLPGWALGFGPSSDLVNILITPSIHGGWGVTRRERSSRACDRTLKIVTWLILPVVICLSQRLSHACLSISNLYGETANGSMGHSTSNSQRGSYP